MARALILVPLLAMLFGCSQPDEPDTSNATADNAAVAIGAGALDRAYANDPSDADLQFAGRPVLIDGDVIAMSKNRHAITLKTGTAPGTTIAHLPNTEAPIGLIGKLAALRCRVVTLRGTQVEAFACAITSIADPAA